MSYLDQLQKIANETLTEHEMNPDVVQPPTPEEVQEAQTGQDTPVQEISDEEMALRQQLDEDAMAEQQQAEQERAEDHAAVDRALLEGAAEEVVSEMEDEEIKDLLIAKAASEMLALGSLATLVDIATNENFDGQTKEAATQTLEYMALSHDNFVDGLNKVASDVYSQPVNQDDLFSVDGIAYIRSNIQKLASYDDLSKVASDDDIDALGAIVENESDQIGEAVEIVEEAYEEALKEIAKEDIKAALLDSGEYAEGLEEGIEEMEQTANINSLLDNMYKRANELVVSNGNKVHSNRPAAKPKKRIGRKAALTAGGVALAGLGGVGATKAVKNKRREPEVEMERVASAQRFLDEVEMYKIANVINADSNDLKVLPKNHGLSGGDGLINPKGKMSPGMKRGLKIAGGVGALGLGTVGAAKLFSNKDQKNKDLQKVASVHDFLNDVEMYKEANLKKKILLNDDLYKQANPIKLVKNLKDNKKKLRKAEEIKKELLDSLKSHTGSLPDEKLHQQFGDVTKDIIDLQKDIRNGELIAYGVPGATLTTGAMIGGKKMADRKKKESMIQEQNQLNF